MTNDYPADLFYPESHSLQEAVWPSYRDRTKAVLYLIKRDPSLSRFKAFNTRLKMACGLQFQFSDRLNITKPDTRACYKLMYRIADVWYAFEHLLNVSDTELPRVTTSKIAQFRPDVFEAIGLSQVERCFPNSSRPTLRRSRSGGASFIRFLHTLSIILRKGRKRHSRGATMR